MCLLEKICASARGRKEHAYNKYCCKSLQLKFFSFLTLSRVTAEPTFISCSLLTISLGLSGETLLSQFAALPGLWVPHLCKHFLQIRFILLSHLNFGSLLGLVTSTTNSVVGCIVRHLYPLMKCTKQRSVFCATYL